MRALFVILLALVIAAPATAQSGSTSRYEPAAFGETERVGDWNIRVVSASTDAFEALHAESEFLDPPADGNVYVVVRFEGTYVGRDVGDLGFDLFFYAVGASNVAYDHQSYCYNIPDARQDVPDVFPSGTVEFNVCWEIAEEDLTNLVVYLEPFGTDGRVFFALPKEGEAATPEASPGA